MDCADDGATATREFRLFEDTTSHARWLGSREAERIYNCSMERKIFWMVFTVLGLIADLLLPIWWGLAATIPILFFSWWVAYRSDWF